MAPKPSTQSTQDQHPSVTRTLDTSVKRTKIAPRPTALALSNRDVNTLPTGPTISQHNTLASFLLPKPRKQQAIVAKTQKRLFDGTLKEDSTCAVDDVGSVQESAVATDDEGVNGEASKEAELLDNLYAEYMQKCARVNLRCLIKCIINSMWAEDMRRVTMLELAAYCHGDLSIQQMLDSDDLRTELSIRPEKCLVRAKPSAGRSSRDNAYIRYTCPDHHETHQWAFHRGYLEAAFIGRFDELFKDADYPLLEALCNDLDASHLCHNSPCSDPFHIFPEIRGININRNREFLRSWATECEHEPRCRIYLR